MSIARVFIADNGSDARTIHARVLAEAGHEIGLGSSAAEVLAALEERDYDLVLIGLGTPPHGGIALLESIKETRPAVLVALTADAPAVTDVLGAFRSGACDFYPSPVDPDQLRTLAQRAVDLRKMGAKRSALAEELDHERHRVLELRRLVGHGDPFRRIMGSSPAIQRLIATLREVAQTESTVLLTGESGTGKGLVARAIHDASARAEGPFVEANCVVYSEGLLHSELFGHERGAFTGAAKLKRGRFELARGGTIFLDEIGEISAATQLLLLRVLQDRTFERVGGEQTIEADARLIAATNRDLQEAIGRGAFRSDLYYRLNVIPIHLPPLRDHLEDVPILAQHFLRTRAGRLGRQVEGFTPEAMEALTRHSWPGNVRELDNLVERLVVLSPGNLVRWDDLPDPLRDVSRTGVRQGAPGTLQEMEYQRIVQALREAYGNKKLAASRLGIHRSTLYAKLRAYGLDDTIRSASDEAKPAEGSSRGRRAS